MAVKAALYLRVSTSGQTVENQEIALRALCTQRGWDVSQVFRDEGISGAKGRDKRPGLDKALTEATRGTYKVLVTWAVDRLGRSLPALLETLQTLHSAGVDLIIHQQGLDTTTPAGLAMYQMLGVFASFERSMVQERVKAGLERARARGVVLGRRGLGESTDAQIRTALAQGLSNRATAQRCQVSQGYVAKIKAMSNKRD